MSVTAERDLLVRRGLWPAGLTIAWNVVEAVAAPGAAPVRGGALAQHVGRRYRVHVD